MSSRIELIVGLGNPGQKYERTRHNAGFWFVDELARRTTTTLKLENKFHGELGKARIDGNEVWLLKPLTFMNRSGQSVGTLARFYKISPENILIAHDELDLPPGTIRLKKGGGHGGHNGLRDSAAQLGSKEFMRLRVGIGHPGHSSEVTNYVLGKAPQSEQILMEQAIDRALDEVSAIVAGEHQKVMNRLHSD